MHKVQDRTRWCSISVNRSDMIVVKDLTIRPPRAGPRERAQMMQFGVTLKSMPGQKAGILLLLDDLNEAREIAAELAIKGIDVEVKRLVKRTPSNPAGSTVPAEGTAPVPA